ncbi:hypothetical protein AB0M41_38530 [Streptomyces sp. NPDC051896]|uniref:hypothetical protein n=1 Tax=Streptomyces sp. NPDC051896 TaxID=3155416 RepID=UPI0034498080
MGPNIIQASATGCRAKAHVDSLSPPKTSGRAVDTIGIEAVTRIHAGEEKSDLEGEQDREK